MKDDLVSSIQGAIRNESLDGWLFYSFRGSDPHCREYSSAGQRVAGYPAVVLFRSGERFTHEDRPRHRAGNARQSSRREADLPSVAAASQPFARGIDRFAPGGDANSPLNAIPYISRVDAGTVELVRSLGVEVASSADLVQVFEAVWTDEQLQTHLVAARHLREIVDVTFKEVARRIRENVATSELDVQDFIWSQYETRGLMSSHRPIVAINQHSADPHYQPDATHNLPMKAGDFLLLDIWAKQRVPRAVYDDITWTGYIGKAVPREFAAIFDVVREGRDAAIQAVQRAYPRQTLYGWQVDDAARESITRAGYGGEFLHRTGHSIHLEDHGNGANIDNLETQDNRRLMRGTCFSIEPGVYLKGKFGVRSEVNVYLAEDQAIVTGPPIQTYVIPILSE